MGVKEKLNQIDSEDQKAFGVYNAQKQQFNALREMAEASGDDDLSMVMAGALTNANDTFDHNERHPDYWWIALESIGESIRGNCLEDKLFPWFKKHGWTI